MARILIVDDEEFVRRLIRHYLKDTTHVVREARDGQEALDIVREEIPDLVVTDNAMPIMTGVEMIKVLKSEHPETKVIAMSGLGVEDAQEYGVDRLLPKPFTRSQFLDSVRVVLEA